MEEEYTHPRRIPIPSRQRIVVEEEQPPVPEEVSPPRTPSPRPEQRVPAPAPPPAPRKQRQKAPLPPPRQQPQRERRRPERFRDPAEQPKEWQGVKGPVPSTEENRPSPPVPIPGPSRPSRVYNPDLPPISPTSSEEALERALFPNPETADEAKPDSSEEDESQSTEDESGSSAEAELLCREGGVRLLSFLIAQAVSPTANAATDPKTWVYRDIARLPQLEQHEWQQACLRELEALRDRKVFDWWNGLKAVRLLRIDGYLISSLMDANTPD